MRWLRIWRTFLWSLFNRQRLYHDVDSELQFHVEQSTAANVSAGMNADEAARAARRSLGNRFLIRQRMHDASGMLWFDTWLSDVRMARRSLRRHLGFSTTCVLILALGIAAATAVFSVVETMLLCPLTYPDGDRLVTLRSVSTLIDFPHTRTAPGTLADWQNEASAFEAIAGYRWHSVDVIDGLESDRLKGLIVTPEFFQVFGIPLQGRAFLEADRGANSVVFGHALWRRRFKEDDALVGKTVDLYARDLSKIGPTRYTVLGVATAPVRFPPFEADFHLGVASVIDTVDFWMPQFVSPTQWREPVGDRSAFEVVGRLRQGVTITQAQAQMDAVARRQAEQYPDTNKGWNVRVVPLREHVVGSARSGVLMLTIGTALLLLIACVNVATLLLSHGIVRGREVATRLAIGASRSRVVRQFLVEAAVLSTWAGVIGILVAAWAIDIARPWLPPRLPMLQEMGINPTVLGLTLIAVILTAGITGIVPGVWFTRPGSADLTGRADRGVTAGKSRMRLINKLVSAEVALTLVLLLAAGLLARSAFRASKVEPGFNADNVLTMTISLPENKFGWEHNAIFARDVISSVRTLSSVIGAAVVQGVPMRSEGFYGSAAIEGYETATTAEEPIFRIRVVSSEYFDVMEIPIVSGRGFEARDEQGDRGSPPSIVVNERFAQRYWQGQNPLGRRIGLSDSWRDAVWWATVVGVARDVRYSGLETAPTPDVYFPQNLFPQAAVTLVTRTKGDPLSAVSSVRRQILAVDEHTFITDIRSMRELIAGSQAERLASTLLVSVFSGIALVLVVVGVYSVVARAVARRRLEFALRSALGAQPSSIVALALRTALQPVLIGIAGGALVAVGAIRLMASVLFDLSVFDVATWAGVCLTVLCTCLVAGLVPSLRLARIDPMQALKAD